MFHNESWKLIYLGVKGECHKTALPAWYLHSCECWLLLVFNNKYSSFISAVNVFLVTVWIAATGQTQASSKKHADNHVGIHHTTILPAAAEGSQKWGSTNEKGPTGRGQLAPSPLPTSNGICGSGVSSVRNQFVCVYNFTESYYFGSSIIWRQKFWGRHAL